VLQSFLEGDRIKEIPARFKKRLVILKWLVNKFEPGRRYSEAEVSERIKQHHEDYAALRRYLVENRLMERDKGVYWRTDAGR